MSSVLLPCELGLNSTLKVFLACRESQLKGIEICELATCKFPNYTAFETVTTLGTDLTVTTFGYRKRSIISFWNLRMLLNNGIEGPSLFSPIRARIQAM